MGLIRVWLFRLLGMLVLAVCIAGVSSTTATAAPAAATLAAIEAPEPQFPNAGMGGFIDPGPGALCTATDKSRYCEYGYGGWLPVTVDYGWGWVPDIVEDQVREGVQKVQDVSKPGNAVQERTGRALSNAMQFWVALGVLLTRLVFNAPELWGLFDPITNTLQHVFGGRVLAMFFALGTGATALFIASKTGKGDVKWAAAATGKGLMILGIAALCAGWTLGPGALFDNALNKSFAAVSQAAGGEARSAEVATGNLLIDVIVWPTFVTSNFGDNDAAAAKYAERVHAASAFTREQAVAMRVSKDVENSTRDKKKDDLLKVVEEIRAEYPDVYKNYFRNTDTMTRGMAGATGLLAALAVVLVLGAMLVVVGLGRLSVRLITAIFPTLGLALQFPTLQHYAGVLLSWMVKAFFFMLAAVVAYVVFVYILVAGVMTAPIPLVWRVVAMLLIVVILWKARHALGEQIKENAVKVNDARKSLQQKAFGSGGGSSTGNSSGSGSGPSSGTGPNFLSSGEEEQPRQRQRAGKPRSKPIDRAVVEQSDPALTGDTKWAPLANPDRYQYRTNEKGRLEQTGFGRKVEADKTRTTLKQKSAVNATALAAVVVTKNPKTGATVKKAGTKAAEVGAEHKARKTEAKRVDTLTRERVRNAPTGRTLPSLTQTSGQVLDLSKVQLPTRERVKA